MLFVFFLYNLKMLRIEEQALTFDDVLLVPQYSNVLPQETDLSTKLTKQVNLKIPIVSAAMDTVTESRMSIALAELGGIGIIHKNIPIADQAKEVSLVKKFESDFGNSTSVGIGMPGAVSADSALVKNANSIWLNGKPFRKDLEKELDRKVNLENDANCFALSEAVDGAGKGHPVVFGVIIGTGVGGGLVINNKIINKKILIIYNYQSGLPLFLSIRYYYNSSKKIKK